MRYMILRGDAQAAPVRAEGDAMIATNDRIALAPTLAEWEMAMGTAAAYCDGFAILLAIQHDRLAQDRARQQWLADFVRERSDIPAIARRKAAFLEWIHSLTSPLHGH